MSADGRFLPVDSLGMMAEGHSVWPSLLVQVLGAHVASWDSFTLRPYRKQNTMGFQKSCLKLEDERFDYKALQNILQCKYVNTVNYM